MLPHIISWLLKFSHSIVQICVHSQLCLGNLFVVCTTFPTSSLFYIFTAILDNSIDIHSEEIHILFSFFFFLFLVGLWLELRTILSTICLSCSTYVCNIFLPIYIKIIVTQQQNWLISQIKIWYVFM